MKAAISMAIVCLALSACHVTERGSDIRGNAVTPPGPGMCGQGDFTITEDGTIRCQPAERESAQ